VPSSLIDDSFVLEPLSPEHNEADYSAWISSVEHIRRTPGFVDSDWPREISLEQNRADLAKHAKEFAERRGFTYTVLDLERVEVLGCVHIYPSKNPIFDAEISSWVRSDRVELDSRLCRRVSEWLSELWPFEAVSYAPRSAIAIEEPTSGDRA
jgi:hypothetical protein